MCVACTTSEQRKHSGGHELQRSHVSHADINLDDGWADHRLPNGTIVANEAKFPGGLVPVIDYIHSKGLKFGLYTSYTGLTCQGLPGSNGYETIDASTYASWGVDYLKEDGEAGSPWGGGRSHTFVSSTDCYGSSNLPAWQSYSKMRDALNATGRRIYFSVCQFLPYVGAFPEMHCAGASCPTRRLSATA